MRAALLCLFFVACASAPRLARVESPIAEPVREEAPTPEPVREIALPPIPPLAAPDPSRAPAEYNYASFKGTNLDMPGFSTFIKGADGAIYHTYSTFGRGIEMANATYNLLDIAPKGRNEEGLPYVMSWVRFHDEYGT